MTTETYRFTRSGWGKPPRPDLRLFRPSTWTWVDAMLIQFIAGGLAAAVPFVLNLAVRFGLVA